MRIAGVLFLAILCTTKMVDAQHVKNSEKHSDLYRFVDSIFKFEFKCRCVSNPRRPQLKNAESASITPGGCPLIILNGRTIPLIALEHRRLSRVKLLKTYYPGDTLFRVIYGESGRNGGIVIRTKQKK